MKLQKRLISAILLLCMIVSLIPLSPRASAEETPAFKLDKDGLDPGATYVIAGYASGKYYALDVSQIAAINNGTATNAFGVELTVTNETVKTDNQNLYWTYEAGTNSFKCGDKYLALNTSTNTTANLKLQDTPYPVLIDESGKANGQYFIYCDSTFSTTYDHYVSYGATSGFKSGHYKLSWSTPLRLFKMDAVTPTMHTLTFDGNGSTTGSNYTVQVEEGQTYNLPNGDAFTKADHTFTGWNTAVNGSGTGYNANAPITVSQDMTLYAQWTPNPKYQVQVNTILDGVYKNIPEILGENLTLQLTLDTGDGTLLPMTSTGAGLYTAQVSENGTYSLWLMDENKDCEDTQIDIKIEGANKTVELKYFSVTYDLNGGTLQNAQLTSVYREGTAVGALPTPVKEGFRFLGWQDHKGNIISAGGVVSSYLSEQTRLTAQWEEVQIDGEAKDVNYVIRYLVKGTYEKIADDCYTHGDIRYPVWANEQASVINKYTYVGATIHGVYIEAEKDPYLTLSEDESQNVLILMYMPNPDLHLHKEATLVEDGTYTIELEMFTHDNPITTIVNQSTPLDIVLVLDQSGSISEGNVMEERDKAVKNFIDLVADHGRNNGTDHRIAVVGYGSGSTTVYSSEDGIIAGSYDSSSKQTNYPVLYTYGSYKYFSPAPKAYVNTGVFDSNGDFHAYPIKGFTYKDFDGSIKMDAEGNVYDVDKNGNVLARDDEGNPILKNVYYTYSADHDEYLLLTYHKVYRHLITEDEAYVENLNGTTIYGYVDGEFVELKRDNSGLWLYGENFNVLYSSEQFFTWHNNVWTHRYGLERREIHAYMVEGEYRSTDGHDSLTVRSEATTNVQKSIYKDALIPVTMGANGTGFVDPSFATMVEKLGANGQTRVSYGMEMAYEILKANPLTPEDKEEGRQRIVVVFTDGKPGDSFNFSEAETNAALEIAKEIKSTDEENGGMSTKIFTIGLYSDDLTNASADVIRSKQDQDDFLNALSSNYYDADSLDALWETYDYTYVREGAAMPVDNGVVLPDGPWYVKVDDRYYQVQLETPLGSKTIDGVTYQVSRWYYVDDNGQEVTCLSYITGGPTNNKIVAPAVGENGLVVGENDVVAGAETMQATFYRRIGVTYNEPDSDQYHELVDKAEKLEEYFATILSTLTTKVSEKVTMTNDAILRDIMGQGLVLTPGTVITVYTEEGTYWHTETGDKGVNWSGVREQVASLTIPENPDNIMYSEEEMEVEGFEDPIPYISVYNLQSTNPTDPNGDNYHPHTVDIIGYDYGSEEWYLNASSPNGKRLIVTITRVEARDNVNWGRLHYTNHEQSGLWLRAVGQQQRELLEAFNQPSTVFVERAYVLDYGKEFDLTGWYFDRKDETASGAVHMDADIESGMNWFNEEAPTTQNGTVDKVQYGNVKIEEGVVTYQPTTTQWGGYDQFYVFGHTDETVITAVGANRKGHLWNKVTIIPANNIYYEDSFGEETAFGENQFSGFIYTGAWETVTNETEDPEAEKPGSNKEHPEHIENDTYGETHGWTDGLADDKMFTDGSAHKVTVTDKTSAKAVFTFTGTGVDVYTRTNSLSGLIVATLSGKNLNGQTVSKGFVMDNLAMSGDYYQIPTVSFDNLDYGTYTVTLIATAASDVATGSKRYEYYLDGIRVYNPLGEVTSASNSTVTNAYGKEINAVYTEIRDIILTANSFTSDFDTEKLGAEGAVFIDWIRENQGTGGDIEGTGVVTYEVGKTYNTYGPKNEVYLTEGQAIVVKVDPRHTYYVGMKSLNPDVPVTVHVSGVGRIAPQVIEVAHSADLYYEVRPFIGDSEDDAYIIIENAITDDGNTALLALTKLRTTNMYATTAESGVMKINAEEAVQTMNTFAVALEEAKNRPEETPEVNVTLDPFEQDKLQTSWLFAAVRNWLEEEKGGAA